MSLSSLLLKATTHHEKDANVDRGLDDIFKATVVGTLGASSAPGSTQISTSTNKRKVGDEASTSTVSKRSKSEKKTQEQKAEKSKERKHKKSKKHDGNVEVEPEPPKDFEVEDSTVPPSGDQEIDLEAGPSESGSDAEFDPSSLIHESLQKGAKSKKKDKSESHTKYVPPDETPEQRNARTIFVGNVPVDVLKSRPLVKQLKRHVLSFVPTAKVESVRFRSVAFQNPTSQLPSSKPVDPKGKEKEGRQHDRERASSWREQQGQKSKGHGDEDDPASGFQNNKMYLTSAEKKRVAFIKHELHTGLDSVNAYIVFAHPVPEDILKKTRPSNVPPPPPVMDPYEAAKVAAQNGDETLFMERTIRIDVVGSSHSQPGIDGKGKGNDVGEVPGDPKRTVFVGNLDFASKEEDLRVFFEGVVSAERGPAPSPIDEEDPNESDEEDKEKLVSAKKSSWVKRVRIIRDKDTLLGKGFAYVQFVDRECVDEVLSMEQDRLKFAKRKLRVQRCKTLPGAKHKIQVKSQTKPSLTTSSRSSTHRPFNESVSTPIPKGDPSLGTKISHLSKDERKQVKAGDTDRVARRLAKKKMAKAKMSLVEKGVKGRDGKDRGDRERVRKTGKERQGGQGDKGKSRGRIRSGKAISKLNMKK